MGINSFLFIATVGMIIIVIFVVFLVIFHQRKIIRFNKVLQIMEEERQRLLLDASIRFQEEERNRIAADLHDDAGPLLATARLYLNENMVTLPPEDIKQNIVGAKQILDDAIMLIRNISHNLMPPTLKNFGLENACIDVFHKIQNSGMVEAKVRFKDYSKRLSPEKELLIFRVIQELINNIFKHSKSSFIHLTQDVHKKSMYFHLQHDGTGLTQADFEKFNKTASGLGLKNIASRVKLLGGAIFFEIDSSSTFYRITIEVPMDK